MVLEEKDQCAVEIVFPNLCGFVDLLNEYRGSSNMSRGRVIYSLLISGEMSGT